MFDGSGKPDGERNVDQSVNFGVTRNTYSAHSKFSQDIQAEKVVDGSGKPEERDSSNAQIRTLLEEQRQMIIAEYCEKIGHHELQVAHAEEERRILREEFWRQQLEFREVHGSDEYKGYGESYENKCATNYSITTNNNWNDAYNKQLTKHDTNDDVDTLHLHFKGRLAYMH